MKVLVVDDSILFRKAMTEVLTSLPDVEVVGQAQNGKLAVQKVRELQPDLVTLDMEMPEMDGLAVLDALKAAGNMPVVIVVSALTRQGGKLTLQALQKGAFDFVTKPETANAEESRKALLEELTPRIKALTLRFGIRGILRGAAAVPQEQTKSQAVAAPRPAIDSVGVRMARLTGAAKPELVLMGVSTGGPNALAVILPTLPLLGVPVLIVQHMPPIFTQSLAESLSSKCALRVREASHGETAEADTIYIAPGGRHMRLVPGPEGCKMIQITDDPPENNCRPAVDYLFRSVAHHFPGRAMGVILTGMGSDGTLGLRLLKRHGCFVIAQDEASSIIYGMPKSAVDAGVVDEVLPLETIAGRIASVVRSGS
ncbi:MAG: chemotaxis response regulator protein-glutamate methylesterase [Syntrophaceae bacterium]|jgi:two-component system, chemotaxis family, protein-glutamate methylesterase/glutaminase|nr:chemotaxis response regulator protein-glutamate methylesterase [Syntrophaceae bacterium]